VATLTAAGRQLEYQWFDPPHDTVRPDAPVLVFLHEGLGSLAMWKDFPARVAAATGCRALVYSRYGYGKSDRLQQARPVDYMHAEALTALPEVLQRLDIGNPVLIQPSSVAIMMTSTIRSGAGTISGLTRNSGTGISTRCCRALLALCSPSRGKTTNTEPWRNSIASRAA